MATTMIDRAKKVFGGIFDRIGEHKLSLVAAGVAFYAFLSVFPAMATIISLYGLIANPQSVEEIFASLSGVVPSDVLGFLRESMREIARDSNSSLTYGLFVGLLLSIWSANRAVKAVSQGLNVAFEKSEDRGLIKLNLVTLGLTLLSSIVVIFALTVIVFMPVVISYFISQGFIRVLTSLLGWAILIALVLALFLLLYQYAPSRDKRPRLAESVPGAVFATILVLIASVGFSFYVSNFGKYDEEYGAISAVVVTMLWLYIGSLIFLLGAEFNSVHREIESGEKKQSEIDESLSEARDSSDR